MNDVPQARMVADYDLDRLSDAELPDGDALVERAHADGHEWLAIALHATLDDEGVVHPRSVVVMPDGESRPIAEIEFPETRRVQVTGGRIRTFEEVLLRAHRAGVSLLVRVGTISALGPLAGGLGVMGAEKPAELRERYVAVVSSERLGKRLRTDAPIAPSALEVGTAGGGVRGALGRRLPNLARASAAADDLVLPLALCGGAKRVSALRATLARRGARLWISHVPPNEEDAARALGADGVVVRYRW